MRRAKVDRLVVVDRRGRVVGIVIRRDLLSVYPGR
ncbi:CBS domain-containing protein [Actinoplanes sp. NPDC089786]